MLIKLENEKPVGSPILEHNFKLLHPNISFPQPITADHVKAFGYGIYKQTEPPTVKPWQKAIEVDPVKNESDVWVQSWEIESLTPQERIEKETYFQITNKRIAEGFLQKSDWTMLPDVDIKNKDEWRAYRAQLRAIAKNPPSEIDQWPQVPEEVWE